MKDYSKYSHYFKNANWTTLTVSDEWMNIDGRGGGGGFFIQDIEDWLIDHHGDTYAVWYNTREHRYKISFSKEEDAMVFELTFG